MKTALRKAKILVTISALILIAFVIAEQVLLIISLTAPIVFTIEERAYIASNTVKWAVEIDYPPFISIDNAGLPTGLSAHYLNLITYYSGLRFEPSKVCSLVECLKGLEKGEVNLVTSIRPTVERSAIFLFSRPYSYSRTYHVFKNGTVPKTVAIGAGYAVNEYVSGQMPNLEIIGTPSDTHSMRRFVAGEVDSLILDKQSFHTLNRMYNISGVILAPLEFEYMYSFGINKHDKILLSILNKTITKIDRIQLGR
jgi:ABC-type amino acid transport substrate-binding protein